MPFGTLRIAKSLPCIYGSRTQTNCKETIRTTEKLTMVLWAIHGGHCDLFFHAFGTWNLDNPFHGRAAANTTTLASPELLLSR